MQAAAALARKVANVALYRMSGKRYTTGKANGDQGMKQAYVNGEPISREAVQFELDRLVKFYATHGMSQAEIKKIGRAHV